MAESDLMQHQHKPPGIRILKGEPCFLKELEKIVASCFRPSEEGNVQEQMMSDLPVAYVQAVNKAMRMTFYGTTRTEINEKRDHYEQRQSNAVHAILQQEREGKPLPKKKLEKLHNEVWFATDHLERAKIAHGAFTKSGGRPIDWFRRCLLMECFHVYAVVTGKLPTQVHGETWHVIAWALQNYHKAHVVRDPFADNVPEKTVRQEDVFYMQHAWHRGNREHFPKDTLKDWPQDKSYKNR